MVRSPLRTAPPIVALVVVICLPAQESVDPSGAELMRSRWPRTGISRGSTLFFPIDVFARKSRRRWVKLRTWRRGSQMSEIRRQQQKLFAEGCRRKSAGFVAKPRDGKCSGGLREAEQ